MTRSIGIDRFLNIRSANGPTFSPDGRFVAFLTNITGVAQLWQVPVAGGWPVQLTFTGESVRTAVYHPHNHEIFYTMDKGGNEQTQIYRLKSSEKADHRLGDGWDSEDLSKAPKAVHHFGGFSHDGERFAFSANRDDAGRFDIYVQTVDGGEAKLLEKGPGGYYLAVGWSPDDKHLLIAREESNFNQDLYVLEISSGKSRHLTAHKEDTQYQSPVWSADGKSIYCVSTAGGRDLLNLARIDVESGKVTNATKAQHEVEHVVASPKGRWLAYLVNVDGRSELNVIDANQDVPLKMETLPLGVVTQMTFSQDDSRLALAFDGPRHNLDVWLWNLGQGKDKPAKNLEQLTHSSRAGLAFSKFVEPELVKYPTFDDREIPAWWYPPAPGSRPSDAGLPPVIVYPHGGPESQTRPAFNSLFQYFLQAGYGILAPNVRGSTGYGTHYMNLDNTTKRMDSVADLAHAAHWLKDQKKADPKRLAVMGGSYGGFMVLAQVTHYPDLWAAGIDIVGIANFVTFIEKTGAYRRANREAEYGNLKEHREFFEKISPINHVDKIKCPMLVVHGANDPRVPVEEAEQIVAALKKRMIPVEYLRYEDEGHGLAKLKNRLDAYPKMVAFLDKYLK